MTYSTWVTVPVRFLFFCQNSWSLWKREILHKVMWSFLLIAAPQQIKGLGGEDTFESSQASVIQVLTFCYSDQLFVKSSTRLVINSCKLEESVKFLCHHLKYQGMLFREATQCSLWYPSLVLILKINYVFSDLIQMLCIFKYNRINTNLVTGWGVLNLTHFLQSVRDKVSSRIMYLVTGSLMKFYCWNRAGSIPSHGTYKQTDLKTTLHTMWPIRK